MYQNIQVHTKMFIDVPYHTSTTYHNVTVHPSTYNYIPEHTRKYQYILGHTSTYQYIPVLIWIPKRCKPVLNQQSSACSWHASCCTERVLWSNTGYATFYFFCIFIHIFLFLPVYLALDDRSTAPVQLGPNLQPSSPLPGIL